MIVSGLALLSAGPLLRLLLRLLLGARGAALALRAFAVLRVLLQPNPRAPVLLQVMLVLLGL